MSKTTNPPTSFKRGAAVSLPARILPNSGSLWVKFNGPLREGTPSGGKSAPWLIPIVDLLTGEESILFVPKVLLTTLQEMSPSEYVGDAFEIEVLPAKKSAGGNSYRPVNLYRAFNAD